VQELIDATKSTGPYCAHCGGQHLGIECRMRAAEAERDVARAERDNAVRMAREVTDDLHAALAERDEVIDRICAAVTFDSGHYPLDVLMIGKLPVAVIVYGPEFVHRVCHEIRKAAEG
jgi:hypothetical protein